jgi:hypothetical protein
MGRHGLSRGIFLDMGRVNHACVPTPGFLYENFFFLLDMGRVRTTRDMYVYMYVYIYREREKEREREREREIQ